MDSEVRGRGEKLRVRLGVEKSVAIGVVEAFEEEREALDEADGDALEEERDEEEPVLPLAATFSVTSFQVTEALSELTIPFPSALSTSQPDG